MPDAPHPVELNEERLLSAQANWQTFKERVRIGREHGGQSAEEQAELNQLSADVEGSGTIPDADDANLFGIVGPKLYSLNAEEYALPKQ